MPALDAGEDTAPESESVPAQDASGEPELSLPSLEDLSSLAAPDTPYERNSDTTRVMPAVRTSQSNMTGGVGSAKSAMERTGDPGMFELAGGTSGPGLRPSKPFDFPFALELDKFGPGTIIGILLLWVAYIAFTWKPGREEMPGYPAWAGAIPAAALLILFAICWLPLFAVGMRQVAAAMKFAVPPRHKTRAAALAALPFALGSVFWLGGESVGTLVTGVILGIAIAAPAAWFLYRLQEKEIPYAAIGLTIAGVVAAALSIALYIGTNLLLNQTLIASGQNKLFIVSPMGPALVWPVPEQPQIASTPKPTTNRAAAPITTPEALPQQAALRDVRGFSFDRPVEDVLFAPGRDDLVGVVSKAPDGSGQEIALYSLVPDRDRGAGKDLSFSKATLWSVAPAPFTPGDTCLSSDGRRMARLVRFRGSVTVHLWSFDSNQLITNYSPADWEPGDTIRLLGFEGTSSSRIICTRRQRGEFRPVTVDLDRLDPENWYDLAQAKRDGGTVLDNRMKDWHGEMVALSPDSTKLAVTAVKMQGNKSYLRIYTYSGQVFDHELRIEASKVALDPVGLAFSPDGERVAVAYAEQGRVSIFTCPTTGKERAVVTASILSSATGPASGESKSGENTKARTNELVWLAGGDHWLYGKMIADGPTQRFIGAVDLGQTSAQQSVFDGRQLMALVNNNGSALIQATIAVAAPAAPTTAESAGPTTRP